LESKTFIFNSDSFSEKAVTGKKLMDDEKTEAVNRKNLFCKNSPPAIDRLSSDLECIYFCHSVQCQVQDDNR
jgi:hypothetical protein